MTIPTTWDWEPFSLAETIAMFEDAPFRWWICGGLALELHAGVSWRTHEDTDVGVVRNESSVWRAWFDGWELFVAGDEAELTQWDGSHLSAGQNNVWVKSRTDSTWALDLTVGEGDDQWIYRRDHRLTRPWEFAILRTDDEVPYLAPDLQLLFKSKDLRAKDHLDAERVIPRLSAAQCEFLARQLPPGHPWLEML